jgi:hypothetical protein
MANAISHSLLVSLAHYPEEMHTGDALDPQCVELSILGLANDIQAILADALAPVGGSYNHVPS